MMPPVLIERLCKLAHRAAPREICGFVLRNWELLPISNVAAGDDGFQMETDELRSAYQKHIHEMIGFYHSHPRGPGAPSGTDIDLAPPGLRYWIVTLDHVYEWDIFDGIARPVN